MNTRKRVALYLECEVAQSPREREVAVDAVELYETSGVLDALALPLVARLVVGGEAQRPPAHRGYRPAVARVGCVQGVAPVTTTIVCSLGMGPKTIYPMMLT